MIGDDSFMDEIDCGNFFDTIDDLIEFPVDDSLPVLPSGPNFTAHTNTTACSGPLPSIWSTQTESLKVSDTVFSDNSNTAPDLDLPADLSVPFGDDPVPLDWLSNFLADSSDGGSLTMNLEESILLDNKDSSHQQFRTSSPVSVLESSSSCSGEKTTAAAPRSPEVITSGKCGRARSKRPRPATFTPRPGMQLISHCSSVTQTDTPRPVLAPKVPSDTENFAESRLIIKLPKHVVGAEHKKRKKIKLTVSPPTVGESQNSPQQQPVRKCMHCEITKTPQWRAGPMGPKTLCNACGVRYKSGRLFPEYRPAASPTFVPSLHSNSHKKVLEMRNKTGAPGTAAVTNNSSEMIPNNNNLALEYM